MVLGSGSRPRQRVPSPKDHLVVRAGGKVKLSEKIGERGIEETSYVEPLLQSKITEAARALTTDCKRSLW